MNKRKISLTPLQQKYALAFILLISIIVVIIFVSIYFLLSYQILPKISFRDNKEYIFLLNTIFLILFETFIVFVILGFFFIIKILNRLIGPFERLTKEVNVMNKLRKYSPLRVREKDEIKPLIEKINSLLKKFKK